MVLEKGPSSLASHASLIRGLLRPAPVTMGPEGLSVFFAFDANQRYAEPPDTRSADHPRGQCIHSLSPSAFLSGDVRPVEAQVVPVLGRLPMRRRADRGPLGAEFLCRLGFSDNANLFHSATSFFRRFPCCRGQPKRANPRVNPPETDPAYCLLTQQKGRSALLLYQPP